MNKLTRSTLIALITTLTLAACSPATTPPSTADATSAPTSVSFYPLNTGLEWNYHRTGEPLTNTPIKTRATGPITHNGVTLLRKTTSGRGISTTRYYSNTSNGLYLHREDRPGTIITYEPPIHHMPAREQLMRGTTWTGATTSTITFPDAPPKNRIETVQLQYEYTVVDQRKVSTPAGTFEAFIINRTAIDTTNNTTVTQEFWFSPYVGELRTTENLILTARNIQ